MSIRNPALVKHPADYVEYVTFWEPWLCDGTAIHTVVEAVSSDAALVVTNPRLLTTTSVGYSVAGGEAPKDYDVTVTIETTRPMVVGKERLSRVFPVRIRD